MEVIDNGAVIQISDNEMKNSQLVQVIKRANGLTISNNKVLMDDLLLALLTMIESNELTNLIIAENENRLNEIFAPIICSSEPESLSKCLSLILDRCRIEDNKDMLLVIFQVLADKFDLSKLNGETVNTILSGVLFNIEQLNNNNEKSFIELFMILLKRIDIANSSKEVIDLLLSALEKRISNEKDTDVKRWFINQLNAHMPNKTMTTPLLPPGTLLYQEDSHGTKNVVIVVEKEKRDILFYKTPYRAVGHPKLLFDFMIIKNKIRSCRIFALKDGAIKPKSILYKYPFGNVGFDGVACWPQLNQIEITEVTQLKNLPALFFKSSTNDHLYSGKNLRELIIDLQEKEFDDTKLDSTGYCLSEKYDL